ncbi:MAG TPA: PQQ-dependent sugar dehydrogenase [Candidatus Eisenbacteria bacterium]|nr:PQQ-dependent sugar dehydrogenase [Candidatus Eisenbacteria bacterium]
MNRRLRPVRAVQAWLLASAFLIAGPHGAGAIPIKTIRVAQGLSMPLFVTAPPGDTARLFIVEQWGGDGRGRIRIVKNGTLLPTPFLTTGVLSTAFEQGLLGLAFAPDYASTGRFYIHYTNTSDDIVIARHTVSANPDIANPTGTILLTIPKNFDTHNGGWIAFGPGGYLYIATGDGGGIGDPSDNAQNRETLLGKILRIDVSGSTYTSPPTNPYAGAIPGRDEIWATGLRNPWRASFDRSTGDLIIADVGQAGYEEVNFAASGTAGANYGWRCYEGNHAYQFSTTNPCGSCTDPSCPMVAPAHEYFHSGGRCSITGGYVYRGYDIPDLRGTYFFGDYCTGEIWSGQFVGGVLTNVQSRNAELEPAGISIDNLSSFGEDARGEMYLCDIGGEVFKIVPVDPSDVEPTPMPARAELRLLGPNPFRAQVHFEATTASSTRGTIEVLDAAGRRVRTLVHDETWHGSRRAAWDGRNDRGTESPSGIYWIRFRAGKSILTERAVLVR